MFIHDTLYISYEGVWHSTYSVVYTRAFDALKSMYEGGIPKLLHPVRAVESGRPRCLQAPSGLKFWLLAVVEST